MCSIEVLLSKEEPRWLSNTNSEDPLPTYLQPEQNKGQEMKV
jgi:hypothetical protein